MTTDAPSPRVGTRTAHGVETYTYDADGSRVSRVAGGITTLYFGGVFEQEKETGTTRSQYTFGGGVIAQRETKGGKGDARLPAW